MIFYQKLCHNSSCNKAYLTIITVIVSKKNDDYYCGYNCNSNNDNIHKNNNDNIDSTKKNSKIITIILIKIKIAIAIMIIRTVCFDSK